MTNIRGIKFIYKVDVNMVVIENIVNVVEIDMKELNGMIEIVKEIIVIEIVKEKEIEIINIIKDVDIVQNLFQGRDHPLKVAIITVNQIEKTERKEENVQEVDWFSMGLIPYQI